MHSTDRSFLIGYNTVNAQSSTVKLKKLELQPFCMNIHITIAMSIIIPVLTAYSFTNTSQLMVPLCLLVITLKIPLLLPCMDSHLTKIRRGYERQQHQPNHHVA